MFTIKRSLEDGAEMTSMIWNSGLRKLIQQKAQQTFLGPKNSQHLGLVLFPTTLLHRIVYSQKH